MDDSDDDIDHNDDGDHKDDGVSARLSRLPRLQILLEQSLCKRLVKCKMVCFLQRVVLIDTRILSKGDCESILVE